MCEEKRDDMVRSKTEKKQFIDQTKEPSKNLKKKVFN